MKIDKSNDLDLKNHFFDLIFDFLSDFSLFPGGIPGFDENTLGMRLWIFQKF